ncbi:unnamed protein product [Brachionus calyciflorus]|uniref:Reverse transcriptase domain-containing protein n=1 Tax=Brachionus calyciflorus TaxID=104777 RepID=A0A813UK56_9BILA|nr:unnamed protein product [Brachionus calyciflorus]
MSNQNTSTINRPVARYSTRQTESNPSSQSTHTSQDAVIELIFLSVIAYCDDFIILSTHIIHKCCQDIIGECSNQWMIKFNALKSAYLSFSNDKLLEYYNFRIGDLNTPKQEGTIYLGLPIGNKEYVNKY